MGDSKIIALVGMTGSGKSEVAKILVEEGYVIIHFGAITTAYLQDRGMSVNEKNERMVRESLRKEHGMNAFAKLNVPKIEKVINQGGKAALDGLYSWEEYLFLKDHFDNNLALLAINAPSKLRYERLAKRPLRPLTELEAKSRDRAEIENLNKGGPIAMADHTILNDGGIDELRLKLIEALEVLD